MKRLITIIPLITVTLLYVGCCRSINPVCQLEETGYGPNIKVSKEELIIRITDKVDPNDEEKIAALQDSVLNELGLNRENVDIEYCPCGDLTRQKWTYDPTLVIEDKLTAMKDEEGDGNIEGDMEFTFILPPEGQGFPAKPKSTMPRITNEYNNGVVIAIIDTGVDLRVIDQSELFQNPADMSCGKGISGWNFVADDNDVQDDHNNVGHGTLVTKLITEGLKRDDIPYQIIPLKVFDRNGVGSYWNIVCAMSFVEEINEKSGGVVKIVNASFGGTLGKIKPEHISILKFYIDELNKDANIIASAGNCHFNTDCRKHQHYPSGYTSKNILAVGGHSLINNQYVLDKESNYGVKNIDMAAPFDHTLLLPIDDPPMQLSLEGTSYSTAYTSYLLAKLMFNGQVTGPDGNSKKNSFLSNGIVGSSPMLEPFIDMGRYVK